MKRLKTFENQNTTKKNMYVLVGPPSVGKSTWIKNTFGDIKPYVINRDDLVEQVAEEYGWTYDDLFQQPIKDIEKEGDVNDKYGKVVKSPEYMTWAPLSYDKVLAANNKVAELFSKRVAGAKGQNNIVVDMTNMNSGARKGALKAIEGSEGDYHKVAVVFNFKGAEDIIKKVAVKRAEEAKKLGKSKTIPPAAFDRMFASFQEIAPDEGFDEVVKVDNTEELKKLVHESVVVKMKYIKLYEEFVLNENVERKSQKFSELLNIDELSKEFKISPEDIEKYISEMQEERDKSHEELKKSNGKGFVEIGSDSARESFISHLRRKKILVPASVLHSKTLSERGVKPGPEFGKLIKEFGERNRNKYMTPDDFKKDIDTFFKERGY